MIDKGEISDHSDTARIKILSEKRKSLDESVEKVRNEVSRCFKEIVDCLKEREKQLLRQIEVVHNHQLSIVQSNWELISAIPSITINLDTEFSDLKQLIDTFGKIELSDNDSIVVKDAEPYRVEEYEDAHRDHVSFDKSIKVNEGNNSDIMKLYNSPISDKISLQFTNANTTPTDSILSNSSNLSFNTSLKQATNNSYLDVSVQQKHKETQTNNCSPLCSTLNNTLTESTDYKFQRLETLNDSSHSCSIKSYESLNGIDSDGIKDSTLDGVDKISDNEVVDLNTKEYESFNKTSDHSNNNEKQNNDEHPKQIQQWLQQILVETETEPSLQEIEQFAEISKVRYRGFEFSLET